MIKHDQRLKIYYNNFSDAHQVIMWHVTPSFSPMWYFLSHPTDDLSFSHTDILNTPVDISRRVCGDQDRLTFREKSWWLRQKQVFKAFNMMSPLQNQNTNTAVWWQKQRIQPQRIKLLSVVLQKRTWLTFVLVIGSVFCSLTCCIWSQLYLCNYCVLSVTINLHNYSI